MTRFVYVLPAGRLRWKVLVFKSETDSRAIFYRRKAHALIAARAIAILIDGEVQPHNRWGRIQDPSSFGSDSPRRRG